MYRIGVGNYALRNTDATKESIELAFKGYDICTDKFFVEIDDRRVLYFDTFDEYYNSCSGNVTVNATYVFVPENKLPTEYQYLKEYVVSSRVVKTISQYSLEDTYDVNRIEEVQKWIPRFARCNTSSKLRSCIYRYKKTDLTEIVSVQDIMLYTALTCEKESVPDIVEACETELEFMQDYGDSVVYYEYNPYLDCFYGYDSHNCNVWFGKSFSELLDVTGGVLYGCDLSAYVGRSVDWDRMAVDQTTKLPYDANVSTIKCINKEYCKGIFSISVKWLTTAEAVLGILYKEFDIFSEFLQFCEYDLSNADLIDASWLVNLPDSCGICFRDAKTVSSVADKFGISYKPINIDGSIVDVDYQGEVCTTEDHSRGGSFSELCVAYLSDVHIERVLLNNFVKSEYDLIYAFNHLQPTYGKLCLLGGDVASSTGLYCAFLKALVRLYSRIFVVLGNHEYWKYDGVESAVYSYRELCKQAGCTLIHNEIVVMLSDNTWRRISYSTLESIDLDILRKMLVCTRLVILGGTGFAGYNIRHNAATGLYREAITREQEIYETRKFEQLYMRLLPVLQVCNTIVLTHNPKCDWCTNPNPDNGIVYINGHTHKNTYYDDGCLRVYSDAQTGYHRSSIISKSMWINTQYDVFSNYSDGIHTIGPDMYIKYLEGLHLHGSYGYKNTVLYMLKRDRYYMFISKSKCGNLTILNGGARKRLPKQPVEYFYNNMQIMIDNVLDPYSKFRKLVGQVAAFIRDVGGYGRVHGSIVDIDYFTHIYIDSSTLYMYFYYAIDMVEKYFYPSLEELLSRRVPRLLENYCNNTFTLKNVLISNDVCRVVLCEDTGMYRHSREIYKMQKLDSKLLTVWYEHLLAIDKDKFIDTEEVCNNYKYKVGD